MQKLEQLLNRIEQYNFECEAGNLINCVDWQELKKEIQPLLPQAGVMRGGTPEPFCTCVQRLGVVMADDGILYCLECRYPSSVQNGA